MDRARRTIATVGGAGRSDGAVDWDPINLRQPIAPQIYDRLRRAIITLAMLPSDALSEKELSLQLGVSRTPVREALIRLADEGLIDILPQRGSFVAPIRLRDVEEAQFIRETLERAVVRRLAKDCQPEILAELKSNLEQQEAAVTRRDLDAFLELDEAFHKTFCDGAGLARSWRVIQTVKLQMDRVRYFSLPEPGHLHSLLAQHRGILDAVEAGDAAGSEVSMATHLQEVLRTVRRLTEQRADLIEPQSIR